MSNEELVAEIQAGALERLGELWEQVERLVRTFAYRYYAATQGRGGVEIEDLMQVGYLALVDAVPRYNPGEAAFSTYFVKYLRKHFQEASGRLYKDTRGQLMPKDALNTALSLNITVDDEDETEMLELVADPATNWESIDNQIWRKQLHVALDDALADIPEDMAEVLRLRNYDRLTLDEISKHQNRRIEGVRQLEQKAIRMLRQPKYQKKLMPFYQFDCYTGTGLEAFRHSGMSVQERYLMLEERENACHG